MKSNEVPVSEYSTFNATYIKIVNPSVDLIEGLENEIDSMISLVETLPTEKLEYRYAERKWTIKEIIQHIIDTERIFSYRALRVSRNDKTPLPGFDENEYVDNAEANNRTIQELLTELKLVRKTTVLLFKSFSDEQLNRQGFASGHSISVRALGFMIIGHQQHHFKVFEERYL